MKTVWQANPLLIFYFDWSRVERSIEKKLASEKIV